MQDIDKTIADNVGLIHAQLYKFNLAHDPEAESIGYEALYNAICNYDSSKGTKLSTVATVYIYNALGSYVRTLNAKRQIPTISYNNIAYTDDSDEHEFIDLLPACEDVEGTYIRKEVGRYAMEVFDKMYDKLTNERHKAILAVWKVSEFTAQTKEIAKQVGVSQSYVSQVINNFKYTLKKELEDIYYD